MANRVEKRGMGWIPDYPDFRDYTEGTKEIKLVLGHGGVRELRVRSCNITMNEKGLINSGLRTVRKIRNSRIVEYWNIGMME